MTKHTEKWVRNLIAGLDEHVDVDTCTKILEQCGRNCIGKSTVEKARRVFSKSDSLKDFLEKYAEVNKHLHLEEDKVYLVYPKCYCPTVNKIPPGLLSATYCNCSRGWAKALFEGATGQQVEVIKEKTIIGGDEECRFRIIF